MSSAVRPHSVTILPPAHRAGGVTPISPSASVVDSTSFTRVIETVSRGPREADTDGSGQFLSYDRRQGGDRRQQGAFTRALDDLLALHRFASTRGLTLNRHPEASDAYDKVQDLGHTGFARVNLNV